MAKLAIYAGHGGADAGACSGGRKEKDYTLAMANTVAGILSGAGHEIIQNRTGDTNRSINHDARLANNNHVDAVIEFHLNAGGGQGSEVYYSIHDGGSKDLASVIQGRLVGLGFKNRGIKTKTGSDGNDYFGIIRMTNAPAVLVELCFIDNDNDITLYHSVTPGVAEHIADTLNQYFIGSAPSPAPPSTETVIYEGNCNCPSLNVRSGAGTSNSILFQVQPSDFIQIYEVLGNGWLRVNTPKGSGYCSAQYVNWAVQASGVCNCPRLNVRTGAGTNYSVSYQITQGTGVNILALLGDWYYIDTPQGRGYCHIDYIDN